MDLAGDVLKIIADYKGLSVGDVTPEKTFESLGIDSLEAIDILYEVEDKFGVDIPSEALDLESTKTVGDLMQVVEKHVDSVGAPTASDGADE